jgi:ubiquinone biosynthesis protein
VTKRILVPTESIPAEAGAVRWAADEANRSDAELLLLRVVESNGNGNGEHRHVRAVADSELTAVAQKLAGGRGRGLTVEASDVADAVVHVAETENADLIVVGNVGMRGRKDFLLKNVPNRISHMARCNVVLVNTIHGDDEPGRPHFHHHNEPPVVPADPSMFEGRMVGRAAKIGRVIAVLGIREELLRRHGGDLEREAQLLVKALQKLGPTFEKLGQMLSTRPDLLPREFIDALSTLQDNVPPLAHADVVRVMEQELHVPLEDVFQSVDPDPVAAGTIAQVHRAVLGNGDPVVIKVQRPTAEEDMCKDLALLKLFAERARGMKSFEQIIDLPAIIDHLSESLQRELDFTREAANIERMRAQLESFSRLEVPRVHTDYTTHRLLVMEEVGGVPLLQAPASPARTEAASQLLESFYLQILTAGFFHADPHPGNLKWWNDKVYLLDFGMVGEIDSHTRDLLSFLLMAFWHEDIPFLGDVILMLAERHGAIDTEAFHHDLAELVDRYRHKALEQLQIGPLMQDLTQLCVTTGIRLPASLAFIGKALGQVQLATAQLEPGLDPFAVAGRFFTRRLTTEVRDMVGPERFVYNARKLRLRFNSLIDSLERLSGARPGWEPKLVLGGTERLEDTIRRTGRRLASAFVSGAAFLVCGLTAAVGHVAVWVPSVFGAVGGVFALFLLVDVLRR